MRLPGYALAAAAALVAFGATACYRPVAPDEPGTMPPPPAQDSSVPPADGSRPRDTMPPPDTGTRPPDVDSGIVVDSAMPPPPPPPGGDGTVSCGSVSGSFGGLTMTACAPDLADPSVPRPLVVALHGYTQSADEYRATTQWDELAGRLGFYVVFAQAPGNRAFYWYTAGRNRGQPDPEGIVAMVDHMKATYAIDEDRVFANGLSAGGYMAVALLAGYPDVFAAGSAFSGGAFGCSAGCASVAGPGSGVAGVTSAFPSWWSDAGTRKPRLMLVHGDRDGVNALGNMDQAMRQWTGALGADSTPDNAALGLPERLKGHPYAAYEHDGEIVVTTHLLEGLGHGTPVDPGDAVDQGGHDPTPGTEQPPGYFDEHDWTNTTTFYGPYYSALFFGIAE